jgi:hypothetical protein
MKMRNKPTTFWAALAAVLLAGGSARAAQNPAYLNIDVTITANLSVSVNGSGSSTHTAVWNTATSNAELVSAASATVTNDSGAQTEKWALSTNLTSLDTTGGGETWALGSSSSSVGSDQFSLQAVFGSSMTAAGASCVPAAHGTWNDSATAPLITNAPQTYTSTRFAASFLNNDGTHLPDITAGGADGRMFASSRRALCWRVITPQTTSTVHQQNIQLIVTAQNP